MNRRRFLAGGCAWCAGVAPVLSLAQLPESQPWSAPARFARPDAATDEGGLWGMMDREESRLRRSPFAVRDAQLQGYIQDIACRLGGEHCSDIRVYLMRTPFFNASMAPNGMMQVWTGLMLRVENEAQLAAVLGHEIGHYLARHSLERLQSARSHSAAAQVLGLFGLVGALGQLGLAASMMSYSREHEREADRIGLVLMHKAGYATPEAAKVWANLQLELKERPDGGARNPLFATHPAPEDRQQELAALAATYEGGVTNAADWQKRVQPFLRDWLTEEVKRGQHEETLALLTRLARDIPSRPEYLVARGETYRLRGSNDDLDKALGDYKAALGLEGVPAEAYRGLGIIQRLRDQPAEARANLLRYLDLAPQAPDAAMIKSYVEELKS
jgi:predicted Zn-dependent protease